MNMGMAPLRPELRDGAPRPLPQLMEFFDRVRSHWIVSNGETMDSRETIRAIGDGSSMEPSLEVEQTICSLRSMVCDLLRRNQELRHALMEATLSVGLTMENNPGHR